MRVFSNDLKEMTHGELGSSCQRLCRGIFPFEFLRVKEGGPASPGQGDGSEDGARDSGGRCWHLKPQRACEVVYINQVCKCVDMKGFLKEVRPTVLRTTGESSMLTAPESL